MKREIRFHFSRETDDLPSVPASILIQTLESAQRAIWLIAMMKEEKTVRSRARISDEIEQRYQLRCRIPEAGSYDLPTYVESNAPLLPTIDQVDSVLEAFEEVAKGLIGRDPAAITNQLPDSAIRRRVIGEFRRIAPKPGSGWLLDLGRNGTTVRFTDRSRNDIQKMIQSVENEPSTETVNGRIIEVKFPERRVTIQLLGGSSSVELTYPEDLEDALLNVAS